MNFTFMLLNGAGILL